MMTEIRDEMCRTWLIVIFMFHQSKSAVTDNKKSKTISKFTLPGSVKMLIGLVDSEHEYISFSTQLTNNHEKVLKLTSGFATVVPTAAVQ